MALTATSGTNCAKANKVSQRFRNSSIRAASSTRPQEYRALQVAFPRRFTDSANFGQITQTLNNPRLMQVALKFKF